MRQDWALQYGQEKDQAAACCRPWRRGGKATRATLTRREHPYTGQESCGTSKKRDASAIAFFTVIATFRASSPSRAVVIGSTEPVATQ